VISTSLQSPGEWVQQVCMDSAGGWPKKTDYLPMLYRMFHLRTSMQP